LNMYNLLLKKILHLGRCSWLNPIILATQKAEIKRTGFQSQHQTNSSQEPIWNKTITEKGLWSDSSCKSGCVASMRPWIQSSVLPKSKK
jgi:hypothetical protein